MLRLDEYILGAEWRPTLQNQLIRKYEKIQAKMKKPLKIQVFSSLL